jgi:hypothetical protein
MFKFVRSTFTVIIGLVCSRVLAEPPIKYSKSTTATGVVIDISTAVFPFGEFSIEVNEEGRNERRRVYWKEPNTERVLLSDGLIWRAPAGIYAAAAKDDTFSILARSGTNGDEVWRYRKTVNGLVPDGIGTLGSFGPFSLLTNEDWQLVTPNEVRILYPKGGYLTLTITHQPLLAGGDQMLVLKDGKPFHPLGFHLPGLENIPEDPIPKDTR